MRYLFTILILHTCLLSCTLSHKDDGGGIIKINDTNIANWDSLLSIDSIIPLEQSDSSLLSMASTVKVGKRSVLFSDAKTNNVFVFDLSGHFKFCAGRVGHASSEHITVRDVNFSPKQDRIEILDERGLVSYNANTGDFIKRISCKSWENKDCYSFMPIEDGKYLFFTPHDDDFAIWKCDKDFKMEGVRKKSSYGFIYDRFSMGNNRVLVLPEYGEYTVDAFLNGELKAAYHFDFGSEAMPSGLVPQTFKEFQKIDSMDEYFKFISSIMETQKYLYASFVGPSQEYYNLFFNKENEETYVGVSDPQLGIILVDADDNSFYGLVYLDYISEDSPFYNRFADFIKSGMRNPILVKLSLKK